MQWGNGAPLPFLALACPPPPWWSAPPEKISTPIWKMVILRIKMAIGIDSGFVDEARRKEDWVTRQPPSTWSDRDPAYTHMVTTSHLYRSWICFHFMKRRTKRQIRNVHLTHQGPHHTNININTNINITININTNINTRTKATTNLHQHQHKH